MRRSRGRGWVVFETASVWWNCGPNHVSDFPKEPMEENWHQIQREWAILERKVQFVDGIQQF